MSRPNHSLSRQHSLPWMTAMNENVPTSPRMFLPSGMGSISHNEATAAFLEQMQHLLTTLQNVLSAWKKRFNKGLSDHVTKSILIHNGPQGPYKLPRAAWTSVEYESRCYGCYALEYYYKNLNYNVKSYNNVDTLFLGELLPAKTRMVYLDWH